MIKIITLFSSTPFASSLANKPEWQKIKESIYLPPSIKTARSTTLRTTRLPWEESPRKTRPPSVSPSEGSTAGSSMYEGPVGIQSTATSSDGVTTIDDNYFVQKFKTRPRQDISHDIICYQNFRNIRCKLLNVSTVCLIGKDM